MLHKIISTKKAPAPGHYSQGRVIEFPDHKIAYTALVTGNDPETDEVVGGDIESQTKQALENLRAIIEAAGGTLNDIVKVSVMFENLARDKQGFDKIYNSFFTDQLPARSLCEVKAVPLTTEKTIIGIEAIAYISK
jgi:2-iminobutanoate/2-iminopropanoate deaminase